MSDLNQLRDLARQVQPPAFDALVTTARRRTRRVAVAVVGVSFAVVILLIGSGAFTGLGVDRSAPPGPVVKPTLPGGVRVLSRAGDDFVPVAGGRYGVRVSDSLLYQVDVPDGSEVLYGAFLNPYSEGAPTRAAILWMEVADEDIALPKDPCHDHTYRRVGSSVEDLATALSNQPFLDVTKPVKTTVGGMNGLFVKATVPADANLSTCQNGNVTIIGNIDSDPKEGYDAPRTVERMWILDVDGTRHILHAIVFPDPGAAKHVPTLNKMVKSITFTHS